MTYKPEVRVGIDWDDDGFIHLDGVGGGSISPLTDPMKPMRWVRAFDKTHSNTINYIPLLNDPVALVELEAKLQEELVRGLTVGLQDSSKVWSSYFPKPYFDGYSLSGVNHAAVDGLNVTTTTTDIMPNLLVAGDDTIVSESDVSDITDSVVTGNDLSDVATTITSTGSGTSNVYDNTASTYLTLTGTSVAVTYTFPTARHVSYFTIKAGTITGNATIRLYRGGTGGTQIASFVRAFSVGQTLEFAVQGDTTTDTVWAITVNAVASDTIDEIELFELPFNRAVGDISSSQLVTFGQDIDLDTVYVPLRLVSDTTSSPTISIDVEDSEGNVLASDDSYDFIGNLTSTMTTYAIPLDTTVSFEAGKQYRVRVYAYYPFGKWRLYVGTNYGKSYRHKKTWQGTNEWFELEDFGLAISFRDAESSSYWDGNLIYVADNVGVAGSGTTGEDLVSCNIGATDYADTGTFSGIALTTGNDYIVQFWVKYVSDIEEVCDYVSCNLKVKQDNGVEILNQDVINPSWNTELEVNKWIPVPVKISVTNTGDVALQITFRSEIHSLDGKIMVTGFMVYDAVALSHNFEPEFLTASDQASVLGSNLLADVTANLTAKTTGGGSNIDNIADGSDTTSWRNAGSPSDFPNYWYVDWNSGADSYKAAYLSIKVVYAAHSPVNWRLVGSNSLTSEFLAGNEGTVLYEETSEPAWADDETREYYFTNSNVYKYYMMFVEEAGFWVWIKEATLKAWTLPAGYEPPTEYVASEFYTATKTYSASDFYNTLLANTTYKVGFYAKADASVTLTYALRDYEHTTTSYTESTGTLNLTTDYQFFELTGATTPSNVHSLVLTLTDTSLGGKTVYLKGYAIYPANEAYHIYASPSAIYDRLDSSNFLLSADYQLGMKKYFDDPLAYEGTMNLVVNNDSRAFSPANVDSPLYGLLQQNRLAIMQIRKSPTADWVTLWSGWTNKFNTTVGRNSNRQAKIECLQGVFRLREGQFSWLPADDLRINDVIPKIIALSGWRTSVTPAQWWLSRSVELGIDTVLVDSDAIWDTIDDGVSSYELVGDGWGVDTTPATAITDMLKAEDAKLWITREGKLFLANRSRWLYFGDATAIDVGSLIRATYRYGEELINTVEVEYTPKEEVQSQVVWRTKSWIQVERHSTSDPILLNYYFEEGSNRTVDNLQLDQKDMIVNVYAVPKRRRRQDKTGITAEAITNQDALDNVTVKTETDGEGRTFLSIENKNKYTVYVDVGIYGDYIEGGEGIVHTFQDLDAIAQYNALHQVRIKSDIITTYSQAKALADHRLKRNAYPTGEFDTIDLISESSVATQQILDLTIGSILSLSEFQVGETNRPHVILGERGQFNAGILTVTYDLARTNEDAFMKLGDNLSPSSIWAY